MTLKKIHIISICLALLSISYVLVAFQKTPEAVRSIVSRLSIPKGPLFAGQEIRFKLVSDLPTTSSENGVLFIHGSYGTTLIEASIKNEEVIYIIPKTYTRRAGYLDWKHIQNGEILDRGSLYISSDTTHLGTIENYVGPRSINANLRDYSMMVSIPTDHLDNMIPDSTKVFLKTQFRDRIQNTKKLITHNIAWQRIPAPLMTGRISTGATLGTIASKERVIDIFPDIATDYTMDVTRTHSFADGNELMTFGTSQIKDQNDNIITDGTLVTFHIRDSNNRYWETTGISRNGYAFAKALHPQIPSTWTIKSSIEGIAQSEEFTITFLSVLQEIPTTLSEDGREITIGPLTSYLGQIIQDGIDVKLYIEESQEPITQLSENGIVSFSFPKEQFPEGPLQLGIETLGLTKTIKTSLN